jgi:hypothetical protein
MVQLQRCCGARARVFHFYVYDREDLSNQLAPEEDVSLRILSGELVLIQPFTEVGLDTLPRKISLSEGRDLQELTSNLHMTHLGRPLCVFFFTLILF